MTTPDKTIPIALVNDAVAAGAASAHPIRTFAACADEAHAAAWEPLDRRYIDVLRHAADHDHALIKVEMHDAAHVVASEPDSSVMADSAASALRACSSK